MKEVILIKNGEMALKGLNRRSFEDAMAKTLRRRLKPLGKMEIVRAQSAMAVVPGDDAFDFEEAVRRVGRVFGISAFSRACVATKDLPDICRTAAAYLAPQLQAAATFKVECKRADKTFPLTSPELARELGGYLLSRFHHLTVDVHNPDLLVVAEVRDFGVYLHGPQLPGAGGLPGGTAGKAAILISGGIDSPVAAWRMARRGVGLTAVHFASPPYTGPRAEQKVRTLLQTVAGYAGPIPLWIVPFTEIQQSIGEACPEELFTIIMRRFMMRCAEQIALKAGCKALITGESVGQVASQTLSALVCTNAVCSLPVFRPLIGSDKEEIVSLARKIGTFETSVLPYEDCCTVFTPRHPKTRPTLEQVEKAEAALEVETLTARAVAGAVLERMD